MHHRVPREGEHELFGTIKAVEFGTARSREVTVTVIGSQHVGIYELMTAWLVEPEGMHGHAFRLFVDREGTPLRLYIGTRRYRGSHSIRNMLRIKQLFVPYSLQGSMGFVTPWR